MKLMIKVRITKITGVMDMEGLLFYRFHLYHITNKKHGKIGWRFHRVLDSGEWGLGREGSKVVRQFGVYSIVW